MLMYLSQLIAGHSIFFQNEILLCCVFFAYMCNSFLSSLIFGLHLFDKYSLQTIRYKYEYASIPMQICSQSFWGPSWECQNVFESVGGWDQNNFTYFTDLLAPPPTLFNVHLVSLSTEPQKTCFCLEKVNNELLWGNF